MTETIDILVAGGGIAGLTAGMTAARLGRSVTVLTGDVLGGHLISIETIEGFPGFPDGVAGYALCPDVQAQAAEAGAGFAMTEVTALSHDGDLWRAATPQGEQAARAVIVATGTSLKALDVPGEREFVGKGVSQCASCDAPLLRGKPVAVVGGGDSALQEALALAEATSHVTIVTDGDAFTAQASFRERIAAHPKIETRFAARVAEITGDSGVTGVRIDGDNDAIEAAGVFIFVGMRPNTGFLDGVAALDETGRIVVDGTLCAGAPGLFAAGLARTGAAGRAAASAGDGALAAVAADRFLAEAD